MAFTAQELNHRITFERRETGTDPAGQPIDTWVQIGEAYARVDPMLGRERFAAMQVTAQAQTKFTMRHLSGVTTDDRLIYNGEPWNLESIINVGGRNRETLIYATRIE